MRNLLSNAFGISFSDVSIKEGVAKLPPKIGVKQVEDKNHNRSGWILDEETTKMMTQSVAGVKNAVSKDQVEKKVALNEKMLLEYLDTLRSVMMMTYPGYYGLGEWEPVRIILETKELEAYFFPEDSDVILILIIVSHWKYQQLLFGTQAKKCKEANSSTNI